MQGFVAAFGGLAIGIEGPRFAPVNLGSYSECYPNPTQEALNRACFSDLLDRGSR